jgi:hypothetical protein
LKYWQSSRPHGAIAKYRIEELQGLLQHLKDEGVLEWFQITKMDAANRDPSV